MKIAILTLSLAAVLLGGCKDNAGNNPKPSQEPAKPVIRLEKVLTGNTLSDQYHYDAKGKLLRHSQPDRGNNDVFGYDAQGHIDKVTYNDRYATRFLYQGDTLVRAEEYDHKNRLAITHSYRFANDRLVELLDRVHATEGDDYYIKTVYKYLPDGNVSTANTSMTQPGGQTFVDQQETRYEQYDNHPNPAPGALSYPFVPTRFLQANNPGKITIRDLRSNKETLVQTNTWQYNEQGYPSQNVQTRMVDGKTYSTTLRYEYLAF